MAKVDENTPMGSVVKTKDGRTGTLSARTPTGQEDEKTDPNMPNYMRVNDPVPQPVNDKNNILVAVTGCSGYVGGKVMEHLYDAGYKVRGTVRSKTSPKNAWIMKNFPNVELFEADLLQEGSFDECFKGCTYVQHTASPVSFDPMDADGNVDSYGQIKTAVNGTKNVLKSAVKAGVKRVVQTSSAAAVFPSEFSSDAGPAEGNFLPDPLVTRDHAWNEGDWNSYQKAEIIFGGYFKSKVDSEKALWDFNLINDIEVAAINPFFVQGPAARGSTRKDGEAIEMLIDILRGGAWHGVYRKDGYLPMSLVFCDSRDVADAHVFMMERGNYSREPVVENRCLCGTMNVGINFDTYAAPLKDVKECEGLPIMYNNLGGGKTKHQFKLDNRRYKKLLGRELIPWQDSIKDMARQFIKIHGYEYFKKGPPAGSEKEKFELGFKESDNPVCGRDMFAALFG